MNQMLRATFIALALTGCGVLDEVLDGDVLDDEILDEDGPLGHLDPELALAGEEALSFVLDFVDEASWEGLGFQSMPTLDELSVEAPVQVFHLHLDELREHDVTVSADTLLRGGGEWWFVIEQNGEPVTMVGVHKPGSAWEVTQIGKSGHIASIEEIRRGKADEHGSAHHEYFLVLVPSLYVDFVGHFEADGSLHLTNLRDHAHHAFEANVTQAANTFLSTLVDAAQDFEHAALPTQGD